MMTLSFFLWFVEFRGNVEIFKRLSAPWRLWGMMALTIYCWQLVDIPMRYLFTFISGHDATRPAMLEKELVFKWKIRKWRVCFTVWLWL